MGKLSFDSTQEVMKYLEGILMAKEYALLQNKINREDLTEKERWNALKELMGDSVIRANALRSLSPDNDKQMTGEAWDAISVESINAVKKKLESPTTLFVEGPDGQLYPKTKMPNQLSEDLYAYGGALFGDYPSATAIGNAFNQYLKHLKSNECEENLYKKIEKNFSDAIKNSAWLLNEDMCDFQASLYSEMSRLTQLDKSINTKLIKSFCDLYNDEKKTIEKLDKELTEPFKSLKDYPNAVEWRNANNELGKEPTPQVGQRFVVVTTSEGGGCHMNIARQSSATFGSYGIRSCVINETKLSANDALKQLVGVDFGFLYPNLFQKLGKSEHRVALAELNAALTSKFTPSNRHSKMRRLMTELNA